MSSAVAKEAKVCAHCLITYLPVKNPLSKFCSTTCSAKARKGITPRNLGVTKKCDQCQTYYQARKKNQRFCCKDCKNREHSPNRTWTAEKREKHRAWMNRNPDKVAAQTESRRAKNYGLTLEELRAVLARGCYAPGCMEGKNGLVGLHIDHDHFCCPGRRSCGKCVRGALCQTHNVALGYIEQHLLFAIWVTKNPSFILKIRREA
jgi:hypothetical protein